MLKTTTFVHIVLLPLSFFVAKIAPNIIEKLLVGGMVFYVLFLGVLAFLPSLNKIDLFLSDSRKFLVLLYPLPFGSYLFGLLNIPRIIKKYKYYKNEPEILIKTPKILEQITAVSDLTKRRVRIIFCR